MKKLRRGRDRIGTVAYYGPTNAAATKVVASVVDRDGEGDMLASRTWLSDAGDVRHDRAITAEVLAFLGGYGVSQTITPDRIVGCPHQEGIDYPMGRTCPACPFWLGLDRFTHKPVTVPAPTMSASEVLATLSSDVTTQPLEALASADGHRLALVEPLLAALDRGIANPAGASEEEGALFSYALYLLAKWRETRAYPYVIRWLSLPDELPFEIGGDIVTDAGPRILAAVFDGDLEPIKTLITNKDADEYGRAAGVSTLSLLAAWAEVPRETIVEILSGLAREGLEGEPSQVWDSLCLSCLEMEAIELFPELRRAYADGLIDEKFVSPEELNTVEAEPRGLRLEETRDRWPPIDDIAEATQWWACFHDQVGDAKDGEPAGELGAEDPDADFEEVEEPYVAPPKVGRNDPCPCGSGKKFKRCHGG